MDENLYLPKGNYLYTYVCTQTYMYVCIYAHIICLYIYTHCISVYMKLMIWRRPGSCFSFFFFQIFGKLP